MEGTPPSLYRENFFERFGKERPDDVKSIEQMAKIQEKKKAERRKRKQLKKQDTGIGADRLRTLEE